MKKLSIFLIVLIFSVPSFASRAYIDSNRVVLALEAIYGIGAGIGGKDCTLCHNSAAGGPGNMNPGFGTDFRITAFDLLGVAGSGLPATGAGNTLQTIFSDMDFQELDSDGDTVSNGDEFQANTDPADNMPSSSSSDGGGGGCGRIAPPKGGGKFPPALLVLFLLPLMTILRLKHGRPERMRRA